MAGAAEAGGGGGGGTEALGEEDVEWVGLSRGLVGSAGA